MHCSDTPGCKVREERPQLRQCECRCSMCRFTPADENVPQHVPNLGGTWNENMKRLSAVYGVQEAIRRVRLLMLREGMSANEAAEKELEGTEQKQMATANAMAKE